MKILKFAKNLGKELLFVVAVMFLFAIPQQVHAKEPDTEVTIYYLPQQNAESSMPQSYQINYSGQNVTYRIVDGDAHLSSDGLVTASAINDVTIEVNADGQIYYVLVHVKNYEVYCDEVIDTYIKENITDTMTDYEKMQAVARFPAQYDYSPLYASYQGMILFGGGDCWASTFAIIEVCERLGIKAWSIDAVSRIEGIPIPGNQHIRALAELNGRYYEIEAGYTAKKDEKTGLRPYSVGGRDSLYRYGHNVDYNGITITDYDAYEQSGVLEIPETIDGLKVTGLGEKIFRNSGYSEIIIPNTVTTIENYAFKDSKLTKIHIPASVTSIGTSPFEGCENLKDISISEDNPSYKEENQIIYTKDGSVLIECPLASEAKIPSTVTKIADFAFYRNSNIRHVEVPESVTEFGTGAFCDTFLKTVTIKGNNLTKIEPFCFGSSDIEVIRIPASVRAIGAYAFSDCRKLKYIYFEGNAPEFGGIYNSGTLNEIFSDNPPTDYFDEVFSDCTATAYYIEGNPTWSPDVLTDHSGKITWVAYAGGDYRSIENAILTVNGKEATLTLDGNVLEQDKDYLIDFYHYWVDKIQYTEVTVVGIGSYDGFLTTTCLTNKVKRKITASVESNKIEENATTRVTVTGLENENCECTYTSDNPAIAQVSGEGIITGITPGTTTITVTVPETDIYEKATATVKITVIGPVATATPIVATPEPTATPIPKPTTDPVTTLEPTATPDIAPTDTPTSVPTSTPDAVPTNTPTPLPTVNPADLPSTSTTPKITVGKKITVNSINYKVTSVILGARTVECTGMKKNSKSIAIPSSVKISGISYKVISIAKNGFKDNSKLSKVTIGANIKNIGKNAFFNCKNLKQIIIKTKKLTTKTVGKNAFKKISSKAIIKVPTGKVKTYNKIIKAKGASKQVKVTK